jgi:hypothetical protein
MRALTIVLTKQVVLTEKTSSNIGFNKTCALLQTTGGKDEPNTVLIRHAPSY